MDQRWPTNSCRDRVLCCVAALVFVGGIWGQDEQDRFRLPTDTVPFRYVVQMTVDLDRLKFFGTVQIELRADNVTSNVTLNSLELNVSNVKLSEKTTDRQLALNGVEVLEDSQMLRFNFDTDLQPRHVYRLVMDFAGNITDEPKGLYRSSYVRGNMKKYIATTLTAPIYARKIFPCYDEPQLKAKFQLRIFHKREFQALSNMPILRIKEFANADNMIRTDFALTPVMSTYRVGFVVSDLGELRVHDKYGAYAQSSIIDWMLRALAVTDEAMGSMEKFLKRPFHLDKLDIVAIDNLPKEAVGYLGLIMFRTTSIVFLKNKHKTEQLNIISKLVYREVSRQWFGDDATSAWWSYMWLYEGFSEYLANYVQDKFTPGRRAMDRFVVDEMHPLMELDVLPQTRPLTAPFATPERIAEFYNFVVSAKAASVIRMWQLSLGDKILEEFLVEYLIDSSGKRITVEDIVEKLQDIADRNNVTHPPMSYLKSWMVNPSFPVITINRFPNGSALATVDPPETFYIPMSWMTMCTKLRTEWFHHTKIYPVYKHEWVLINHNQTGYYRVNYDKKNWLQLAKSLWTFTFLLNREIMPPLSRAQLIDDALAFVKNDQLDISILMEILRHMPRETNLIPLKAGFKAYRYLHRLMQGYGPSLYLRGQTSTLDQIYGKMIKNTTNNHVSRLYRAEVRKVACELGVRRCLQDSKRLYKNFATIEPDLRAPVICGAMQTGESNKMWTMAVDRLLRIAKNLELKRNNIDEFEDILYGLGCANGLTQMKNNMMLSLDELAPLEKSDRIKIFNNIVNNGVNGTKMALSRLKTDFRKLRRVYGSVTEILENLKYTITTDELLTQFDYFQAFNKDYALLYLLQEVRSEAVNHLMFVQRKYRDHKKWALSRGPFDPNDLPTCTPVTSRCSYKGDRIQYCWTIPVPLSYN